MAAHLKEKVIGHYKIGRKLGSGTFGHVRIGVHTLTAQMVAIKILDKDKIVDRTDVERVSREMHILKLVRHPHVIQLYEIVETPTQLYLIMEYASGGELFDYIVSQERLEEVEACRIFHQIVSGLNAVHQHNVAHRDLKPENLLFDGSRNIKIVDFGLSNTYTRDQLLETACGSPCYASPEMIDGAQYEGSASDVWSIGVILYAMLCGSLPFEDQNTAILYKKITSGYYTVPSFVSEPARHLLRSILVTDPSRRVTLDGIKQSKWYMGCVGAAEGGSGRIRTVHFTSQGRDDGCRISTCIMCRLHVNSETLDEQILSEMLRLKFPVDYVIRSLKLDRHNHATTTYYLLLANKTGDLRKRYSTPFLKDESANITCETMDASRYSNAGHVRRSPDLSLPPLECISIPERAHHLVLRPVPVRPTDTLQEVSTPKRPAWVPQVAVNSTPLAPYSSVQRPSSSPIERYKSPRIPSNLFKPTVSSEAKKRVMQTHRPQAPFGSTTSRFGGPPFSTSRQTHSPSISVIFQDRLNGSRLGATHPVPRSIPVLRTVNFPAFSRLR